MVLGDLAEKESGNKSSGWRQRSYRSIMNRRTRCDRAGVPFYSRSASLLPVPPPPPPVGVAPIGKENEVPNSWEDVVDVVPSLALSHPPKWRWADGDAWSDEEVFPLTSCVLSSDALEGGGNGVSAACAGSAAAPLESGNAVSSGGNDVSAACAGSAAAPLASGNKTFVEHDAKASDQVKQQIVEPDVSVESPSWLSSPAKEFVPINAVPYPDVPFLFETIEFQKQHLAFLGGRLTSYEHIVHEQLGFTSNGCPNCPEPVPPSIFELHVCSIPATDVSICTNVSAAPGAGSAAALSNNSECELVGGLSAAPVAGSAAALSNFTECEHVGGSSAAPVAGSAAALSINSNVASGSGSSAAISAGSAAAADCILDQHGVPAAISAGSAAAADCYLEAFGDPPVTSAAPGAGSAAANCLSESALVVKVFTMVAEMIPSLFQRSLPAVLGPFGDLMLSKCAKLIDANYEQTVTTTPKCEQMSETDPILLQVEQIIDAKLALSYHPSTILSAADDIVAEVLFDLTRAVACEGMKRHQAAFQYTGKYVQLQCLNHTEYNGLLGYVLGSLDNGRLAVIVPALGFRLSLWKEKLRVLSIEEFEQQFEWLCSKWQPEYHTLVGAQIKLFKKEQLQVFNQPQQSSTSDAQPPANTAGKPTCQWPREQIFNDEVFNMTV